MADSFKYVNMRRLAELEYELRLAEIDLTEQEDTCALPEKHLILDVLTAKVKLARWKVQSWIASRLPNYSLPRE